MRGLDAKRAGNLVLAVVSGLVCWTGSLSAQSLTSAEQDGYLIWLHALESTIDSRKAAGLSESSASRSFYPRHIESAQELAVSSLVDVARALEDIESRPRLLQETMPPSALHALNRARNYAHLAAYDSALVWYEIGAQRDLEREHAADMGRESMAAAIVVGSEQSVQSRMHDLMTLQDLTGREVEIELLFRFLLSRADTVHLIELVDTLPARHGAQEGRIKYWRAFTLNWLGRWAKSLELLKELVTVDGFSHGLDEAQRAWVLTAIADQVFLLGDRQAAAQLYRALASSSIGEAAIWAACQVAAFDLLDGHFLKAGTALERLCKVKENQTWRQHACRLAFLSDELERLRDEGRSHGADVYYKP